MHFDFLWSFPSVAWFPHSFGVRIKFSNRRTSNLFQTPRMWKPTHTCLNQMVCSLLLSRTKYRFEGSCSEFNLPISGILSHRMSWWNCLLHGVQLPIQINLAPIQSHCTSDSVSSIHHLEHIRHYALFGLDGTLRIWWYASNMLLFSFQPLIGLGVYVGVPVGWCWYVMPIQVGDSSPTSWCRMEPWNSRTAVAKRMARRPSFSKMLARRCQRYWKFAKLPGADFNKMHVPLPFLFYNFLHIAVWNLILHDTSFTDLPWVRHFGVWFLSI